MGCTRQQRKPAASLAKPPAEVVSRSKSSSRAAASSTTHDIQTLATGTIVRFKNCQQTEFNGKLGKLTQCQENGKWEIRLLDAGTRPVYVLANPSKFVVHLSAEGVKARAKGKTQPSSLLAASRGVGNKRGRGSSSHGVGRAFEHGVGPKRDVSILEDKASEKDERRFRVDGRGTVVEVLENEEDSYQRWMSDEREKDKEEQRRKYREKGAAEYGKGLRKKKRSLRKFEAEADEGSEERSSSSSDSEDEQDLSDSKSASARASRSAKRVERKETAASELFTHLSETNRRERRRESAMEMCGEALKQLDRRQRGQVLNRRERGLAKLGETLSPAKLYGAMSRPGASRAPGDSSASEFRSDTGGIISDVSTSSDGSDEDLSDSDGSDGESVNSSDEEFLDDSDGKEHQRKESRAGGGSQRAASRTRQEPPKSKRQSASSKIQSTPDAPLKQSKSAAKSITEEQLANEQGASRGQANGATRETAPALSRLSSSNTLCFSLCEILEIPPATARELLENEECFDEEGNPEMNKAISLFWKLQAHSERAQRQQEREVHMQERDHLQSESDRNQVKVPDAPRRSGGFTQTLEVPEDWDVGQAPKGGLHYSTFRRKLNEVHRYNRKTGEDGPKLTVKSLVSYDLKAGLEARCGLSKHCWNLENAAKNPGLSEEDFVSAVRRTLRPSRKADYKSDLEGMKMDDRGQKGHALLEALTTWGIKWLAKLREAEEAGVKINSNWLKLTFKEAVDIAPFKKWLRGRSWPKHNGGAVWYRYLCDKLKKKASHADEDSREASHGSDGNHYYRGKRTDPSNYQTNTGGHRATTYPPFRPDAASTGQKPTNQRAFVDFKNHSAEESDKFWQHHQHEERSAQFNTHSGGTEPMQYQRDGGGARGRGGGATRGNHQGQSQRDQHRDRLPINDPAEEQVSKLSKGKWWHDSTDLSCVCKTVDCGAKQEVPFCQGCGQHHHSREFCFKRNDSRFNSSGYWSDNRKGQPPISSLGGSYPGSPTKRVNFEQQPKIPPPAPARLNVSDASAGM